ncbi:MAG: zinc-ribbon domain-containing protein [Candidatus Bathyarchaeota archaeon]
MYCTKCGTENLDDASVCANCGSSLSSQPVRNRRKDWDMEDNCFGGRDRSTGPIFFGAIIILVGLSTLLSKTYSWAGFDNLWPLIIIAIGLIVVYNAAQRRK